MSTIVMVEQFIVEDQSKDKGHVFEENLGYFSNMRLAKECMHRDIARRRKDYPEYWEPGSACVQRYYLSRYHLDRFPRWRAAQIGFSVFDQDGASVGSHRHSNALFPGRAAESCRYRRGDRVGFFHGGSWQICVVTGLPPDPELVARLSSRVEAWEDVYMVGYWHPPDPDLSDRDACYDAASHDHIPECMLVPITVPLDPRLDELLEARREW
ncbi:MAG: hypothetical protein RBU30_23815 [Polyangia bacterium]|jgi:hypothetical protein|nr:hypothetical protein [Polyangia bacterium]